MRHRELEIRHCFPSSPSGLTEALTNGSCGIVCVSVRHTSTLASNALLLLQPSRLIRWASAASAVLQIRREACLADLRAILRWRRYVDSRYGHRTRLRIVIGSSPARD